MARVLYVSLTGLSEPLGQSQVLQYLIGLARTHDVELLTVEKSAVLVQRGFRAGLESVCNTAGIKWKPRVYADEWGLAAKMLGLALLVVDAVIICWGRRVDIVHCRGYLGGVVGYLVKGVRGCKFIFDMRGFWPDERVDGGVWRRGGIVYRVVKWVEKRLLARADCIVSLTRAAESELMARGGADVSGRYIAVIPTCVNTELFRFSPKSSLPNSGRFVLGYLGSVGTWYLFREVAVATRRLFDIRSEARLLVLNKGGHDRIRSDLVREGVDMSRVEIREVGYEEVSAHIAEMDAGIFFYKPSWSKKATCPTRMAEFLACGKPCFSNAGVGDVEEVLSKTNTGVVLPTAPNGGIDLRSLDSRLQDLIELACEPSTPQRCRSVAESHFSLRRGVGLYSAIYERLSGSS